MPKLITCRGIGEPMWNNMLGGLAKQLPDFQRVDVGYSSAYGPVGDGPFGQSFDLTLAQGGRMLREELDKGPAVVAGYSAGAGIAGNVGILRHPNMKALALVADPFQPQGVSSNGKWGVAGSRPIPGVQVKWVFNPEDMICQSAATSPVRTIADQSATLSLAAPDAWARDLLTRWQRDQWQPISPTFNPEELLFRLVDAGLALRGYLRGGAHNAAYNLWRVDGGSTRIEVLADWVREVGR